MPGTKRFDEDTGLRVINFSRAGGGGVWLDDKLLPDPITSMRLVCENNPRAISSEINHEKKKRRNDNNRENGMARLKITLRVRSFRRRFFDQFEEITFLRFRLFFFFSILFSNFSNFFPRRMWKNDTEIMKNCLGSFLDRSKITILAYLFPLLYVHWWRRWVGARGFPWLVIQVNYDCTRKTREEKENGRRSIFQRVFPRFSWVDITFHITCLEGMKSRALCALVGWLVGCGDSWCW